VPVVLKKAHTRPVGKKVAEQYARGDRRQREDCQANPKPVRAIQQVLDERTRLILDCRPRVLIWADTEDMRVAVNLIGSERVGYTMQVNGVGPLQNDDLPGFWTPAAFWQRSTNPRFMVSFELVESLDTVPPWLTINLGVAVPAQKNEVVIFIPRRQVS
jgi:hypothetical protein